MPSAVKQLRQGRDEAVCRNRSSDLAVEEAYAGLAAAAVHSHSPGMTQCPQHVGAVPVSTVSRAGLYVNVVVGTG